MPNALKDIQARLDELTLDLEFLTLAIKLRPRLGDITRWEVGGDVIDLARSFMGARTNRPEALYAAILVRLLATFERFLRTLVDSTVERRAAAATTYDQLPAALSNRNIVLTGRILSAIDTPRDHLAFNVATLIDNLATCRSGNATFKLNATVFSAVVSGASPAVVEKALNSVDVTEFWDVVGASEKLATLLGTKGPRATGDHAKERLKELWRWRNHLAHGGDEDVLLSEAQLRDAVAFVSTLAAALDTAVNKHLKKAGVA